MRTTKRVVLALIRISMVLFLLLIADAVWVGVRGLQARNHLDDARAEITETRSELAHDNFAAALTDAGDAEQDTSSAQQLTGDPVWHFDAHLPVVGSAFTSGRVVASAVDDVAHNVLPVLASGLVDLQGSKLRNSSGVIDVARLQSAATGLIRADATVDLAQSRVAGAPARTMLGGLDRARAQLLTQLEGISVDLDGLTAAARVAPSMLGANGTRTYFLAQVNPAESRGIGGLLGTYGIVTADHGRLRLTRAGTDADFRDFVSAPGHVGGDYSRIWDRFGAETVWRNAGTSPDFPADAATLLAMWKKRTGQQLDGVLLLDPGATGSLVTATHPITLPDGTVLRSSTELTTYVESTLYTKYGGDGDQGPRKLALVALQKQLFADITAGGDATRLLQTLGAQAGQRRLLLMSSHPAEQAVLAGQPIGGALPFDARPYALVTVQNQIGNKVDYYTDESVRWSAGACPSGKASRVVTLGLTLHDGAPSTGLTHYVGGTSVPMLATRPLGSNRSWVSVYGSSGAVPTGATLDGQPASVAVDSERGHPLVSLYLDFAPGQSHDLVVTWADPSRGPAHPLVLPPSARAPSLSSDIPTCPSS